MSVANATVASKLDSILTFLEEMVQSEGDQQGISQDKINQVISHLETLFKDLKVEVMSTPVQPINNVTANFNMIIGNDVASQLIDAMVKSKEMDKTQDITEPNTAIVGAHETSSRWNRNSGYNWNWNYPMWWSYPSTYQYWYNNSFYPYWWNGMYYVGKRRSGNIGSSQHGRSHSHSSFMGIDASSVLSFTRDNCATTDTQCTATIVYKQ